MKPERAVECVVSLLGMEPRALGTLGKDRTSELSCILTQRKAALSTSQLLGASPVKKEAQIGSLYVVQAGLEPTVPQAGLSSCISLPSAGIPGVCQHTQLEDTLDEYFEYDAEEFLVSLALLITEGRTPECSVKGRAESFHCPPAQSRHPGATQHECSDKLAQCRQARRTRADVALLWKSSLPIMVEVMLLPDCCYGDDGPSTEGTHLNDPAIEQDALLLERWVLEPVPRQSSGRFVEEKTLLLAVRSFVFFSQLSAWLSVSHGAVPRNILYRISAADADLQWHFPQTPVEHVFPVPNVSHNVALKVSVQSLPRQSNYPVLSCSIHTNLGLYEERIQEHEHKARQHHGSAEAEHYSLNSPQRLCARQAWAVAPESALHVRDGPAPEHAAATRNGGSLPVVGRKSPYETSQASLLGLNGLGDMKPHETPMKTWKSLSVVDPSISGQQSSWQPAGKANPLIDSLIQDRQKVIARIAQHLIHCDSSTPHVATHPFATQESNPLHPKLCQASREKDDVRKCKDAFSISFGGPEFTSTEDASKGQIRRKQDPLKSETHVPGAPSSHQSTGEANPLIGSLLQERQDVIARIAHHLEHIEPTASHSPRPALHLHDPNSLPSKVFRSFCDGRHLWKKNADDAPPSLPPSKLSLSGDSTNRTDLLPEKACSSFKCGSREKSSVKPQVWTQCQHRPPDSVQSACPEARDKAAALLTSSNVSQCSASDLGPISRLEKTCAEAQFKGQEGSAGIDKQCSDRNSVDKRICTNKCKGKIMNNDHYNLESFDSIQFDNSKTIDSNTEVTMWEIPEHLNKYENNCSDKNSAKPKTYEHSAQLSSIENYLNNNKSFKCKKSDQLKTEEDNKEDAIVEKTQNCSQRKSVKGCLSTCEQMKNTKTLRTALKYSSVWQKPNFHSLDGTSTRAFHPRTGLPLLSSPVPQRKTQSGCFDLDSSLLHLKRLSSRSPRPSLNIEDDPNIHEKPFLSSSAPPITSLSLLGNFEESVLNYRLDPLGVVDGFTAEVGASGVFCPTHLTLPVEVSFYSVSDDNAPSPYMTLFNPNKTVVKMFVVMYDLRAMPASHQTFLRQRTFSVPVKPTARPGAGQECTQHTEERLLRYLIHLRFQSSKSGKIYLHRDVRLLFSRKSMEVDSGAAYELKSHTESPTNPQFSPRC
ncbi:atos homolog protein A isoform X2 [Cavia porcellus]|uniref:atos homolog protein A isoform X2 n=1 Tax=Cavia porcellus TaxID=10141 RepID=UPI000C87BCCF|nr:protein FAM214A isoform X3 [Cavia porcellus]